MDGILYARLTKVYRILYLCGMNKKDLLKAFMTGVFSIFPVFSGLPDFKPVDRENGAIVPRKSVVPPVKVRLRPVIEDVGACFDDVGDKLRMSMQRLSGR